MYIKIYMEMYIKNQNVGEVHIMKFVLKYYADEILEVNAELTPTHLVLSQGCRNIWDKEQESEKEKV